MVFVTQLVSVAGLAAALNSSTCAAQSALSGRGATAGAAAGAAVPGVSSDQLSVLSGHGASTGSWGTCKDTAHNLIHGFIISLLI